MTLSLNKFKNYFGFRVRYIFRQINYDFDSILVYAIIWTTIALTNFQSPWIHLTLSIIPSIYFHLNRGDLSFLRKVFYKNIYFLILCEYFILCSISQIIILFKFEFCSIYLINITVCILLPLINIKKFKLTNSIDLKWISMDVYEWKSYMRRKPLNFTITYSLFILSAIHPFTFGIMTFLFCGLINSIYSYKESKEIYSMYFQENSLENKIQNSLSFFFKITVPPLLISVFINPLLISIALCIYCILIMFFIKIILYKYAHYSCDYNKIKPIGTTGIIEIFCSILLVLPWIHNYFKMKEIGTSKINEYVKN